MVNKTNPNIHLKQQSTSKLRQVGCGRPNVSYLGGWFNSFKTAELRGTLEVIKSSPSQGGTSGGQLIPSVFLMGCSPIFLKKMA